MINLQGSRFIAVVSLALVFASPISWCAAAKEPEDTQEKNRQMSVRNMEAIGKAMMSYVGAQKRFPSATGTIQSYNASDSRNSVLEGNRPLLSWRVHLLPFLDDPKANQLANQFKMNEPWDSETNKKLIDKMPDVYKAPGSMAATEFKTVYLTPRGEKTLFPANRASKIKDITDGTIRTMMLLEVSDDRSVLWTKPDDYEIDEQNPIAGLVGLRSKAFLALFANGAVRTLPANISPQLVNALYTRAGGENVPLSVIDDGTSRPPTRSPPAKQPGSESDNLRQIGQALLTHMDHYHHFPAAMRGGKTDNGGGPALSWRVRILPYVGEGQLFQQFKLDEPWDSEHNKKLIEKMPAAYKAQGSKAAAEFKTVYLTLRGEKTAFPGQLEINGGQMSFDGFMNTILVVEASDDKAVIWTKPDDYEYDEKNPQVGLVGLRKGGFLAVFGNGDIRFISEDMPASTLIAFYTRNGGERIEDRPPLFPPRRNQPAQTNDRTTTPPTLPTVRPPSSN